MGSDSFWSRQEQAVTSCQSLQSETGSSPCDLGNTPKWAWENAPNSKYSSVDSPDCHRGQPIASSAMLGLLCGRSVPVYWTNITIEKCDQYSPANAQPSCTYDLCLPLLGDGRIGFAELRTSPDPAVVTKYASTARKLTGRIRLLDGQWSFVWTCHAGYQAPIVRFFASRFLMNDPVCLRSSGRPMRLYRVCSFTRTVGKPATDD